MKLTSKTKLKTYDPNLGFIGNTEVKVANYLFSQKRKRQSYPHASNITKRILKNDVANHFVESKKLTKFLKTRDLTFSKKTNKGYKTFVVPCTTTVVPFQKSLFNNVEAAAQRLMISLRCVLQDIYGSANIESSSFVQSLPSNVKQIFIDSVSNCPTYLPQLHHPNMKNYPFLDNVGLDLVLVEDYLEESLNFPQMIAEGLDLPELPFRILEINAGSPSGASNNLNMLEGIYKQTPEILDSLGKLMPNDHFQVLGETYKSLGESWTGITDGVQIILPPGGQNGAAPEIHQLAAYSGLIYADPDQLYQDDKGYIRLRTVGNNPIVTAVYSRVNTDSALFDPKRELLLRDQDTGSKIYLKDALRLGEDGEAPYVLDADGNKIPLQSAFSIPGAIDAIHNRKLYMGGLNRIMDNKIILATLTHYAPKFFGHEIIKRGLELEGGKISPPQTLPPTAASVETICANPDSWVVKSPSLAGGQGVFILKTLNAAKKAEIISMIKKNPKGFAYQQLVKIARIPVAVQRKQEGYKLANLAADIRMWVFFGGGEYELPRLSHNALVRYAPHEKGAMSSIVNTSSGGGYAPFVIIDDTNSELAVSAAELTTAKSPIPHKTPLPIFVGASMVQISRMIKELGENLQKEETTVNELYSTMVGIKLQLKEVLSFLNPRGMEYIYQAIDLLELKIKKTQLARYYKKLGNNQLDTIKILKSSESKIPRKVIDKLEAITAMHVDTVNGGYNEQMKQKDKQLLKELRVLLKGCSFGESKEARKLLRTIKQSVDLELPVALASTRLKNKVRSLVEQFCESSIERLNASVFTKDFSELFDFNSSVTELSFETLYLGDRDTDRDIRIATQLEQRSGERIIESDLVSEELKQARLAWMTIEKKSKSVKNKEKYLATQRTKHFNNYPSLIRMQELLSKVSPTVDELIELMPIVPYAKFNIEQLAKDNNVSVKNLFSRTLKSNKISLLSDRQIKLAKLDSRNQAGECFAKKKRSHGLYSESDILIWLRSNNDAFTILYTIGHEIVHSRQLKASMEAEQRALEDGGVSVAKFINYYGNFLGANMRTVESINFKLQPDRTPLYGYSDRAIIDFQNPVISELRENLNKGNDYWAKKLKEYGSLFGFIMPNAAGTRVKALQEVIPALENAKNISFAKELGLIVNRCEVQSALPIANKNQVRRYRKDILKAVNSAQMQWNSLRIIGNHQYYGVTFYKSDRDSTALCLKPPALSITIGSSYNQTQQ